MKYRGGFLEPWNVGTHADSILKYRLVATYDAVKRLKTLVLLAAPGPKLALTASWKANNTSLLFDYFTTTFTIKMHTVTPSHSLQDWFFERRICLKAAVVLLWRTRVKVLQIAICIYNYIHNIDSCLATYRCAATYRCTAPDSVLLHGRRFLIVMSMRPKEGKWTEDPLPRVDLVSQLLTTFRTWWISFFQLCRATAHKYDTCYISRFWSPCLVLMISCCS